LINWNRECPRPSALHLDAVAAPNQTKNNAPPEKPLKQKQNKLGGGEGVEGIYGSITATGMQRVLDCLARSCGMTGDGGAGGGAGGGSALLDVGAGLGRPLLHAAVSHGVRRLYGVEIDRVKVAKAEAFVRQAVAALAVKGVPYLDDERQRRQEAGGGGGPAAVASAPADEAAAADSAAPTTTGSDSLDATDTRAEDVGEASLANETGAAAAGATADAAATAPATTTKPTTKPTAAKTTAAKPPPATAAAATPPPTALPLITCCPVERLAPDALAHVTHAYSFWEGVPRHARMAFGRLFAASPRARGVAVVQRAMRGGGRGNKGGGCPASAEMAALGFGSLALVRAFPVAMSGSGRAFTAYVFMRVRPLAPMLAAPLPPPPLRAPASDIGGRKGQKEEGDEDGDAPAAVGDTYLRTSSADPAGGRRGRRAAGGAAGTAAAPDAGSPCKRASAAERPDGAAPAASPEKKARATPARHMTRSQSAALAAAELDDEEEEGEEEVAAPAVRKALSFAPPCTDDDAVATAAPAPAAAAPAPPRPAGRASKQTALGFRERKRGAARPASTAAGKKEGLLAAAGPTTTGERPPAVAA